MKREPVMVPLKRIGDLEPNGWCQAQKGDLEPNGWCRAQNRETWNLKDGAKHTRRLGT
jgi:hypothetical protein